MREWDEHPIALDDAWILRKGEKAAHCVLAAHQLGRGLLAISRRLDNRLTLG